MPMRDGVRHSFAPLDKVKGALPWLFTFLVILIVSSCAAWLARGGQDWWIIDFVSGANVLWGDDAYRYYLSTLAFQEADVYFFSFALPLAVLFDGALLEIFGDQSAVRFLKAFMLAGSGGVMAAVLSRIMSAAYSVIIVLLVFCFPLNLLVSISYFGESWFIIVSSFFVAALVLRKSVAAAIFVAILPFFRIEGLLFIVAFSFVCVRSEQYRLAIIPFIPGLLYVLAIIVWGPGISGYINWRAPMNEVYAGAEVWYQFQANILWLSINAPLFCLALLGLLLSKEYKAYALPLMGIPSLFVILSLIDKSSFEPRYLTMSASLIPLGVALFIYRMKQLVWGLSRNHNLLLWQGSRIAAVCLFVWSFWFGMMSIHPFSEIYRYYASNGELPYEVREQPFRMDTYFKKISSEDKETYRELAGAVEKAIEEYPDMEILVVSNFLLFYFLDSDRISRSVTPVFALFGRGRLDPILGDSLSAGYFHRPPYFSFISMEQPFRGDRLVLYIDYIPEKAYPLKWKVAGHDLAIFGGSFIDKNELETWRGRRLSVPRRPF